MEAQTLSSLNVNNVAETIVGKVAAKFDSSFKTVDQSVVEKLVTQLETEGKKYVEQTGNSFNSDIDTRYKNAVDAVNALTTMGVVQKKKLTLEFKFYQMMAKNQIADAFDNFDDMVTDFGKNVLVSFAQRTSASEDDVLNNLQSRLNEIQNKLREVLNNYIKLDDDHRKLVDDSLK